MPAECAPHYDTAGYDRRFADPRLMCEAEMRRARTAMDWPTDGMPTVQPNLGEIFVPSIAERGYEIKPDQMPWPGAPLDSWMSAALFRTPLRQRTGGCY